MIQNFASGKTVCATPVANIDIVCGFQPHHVIVWSTDGDGTQTNGLKLEWNDSMAVAAGIISDGVDGDLSTATTGITVQDHGFRIGVGCQYAALDLHWIAM
jgi:hypothetical protein